MMVHGFEKLGQNFQVALRKELPHGPIMVDEKVKPEDDAGIKYYDLGKHFTEKAEIKWRKPITNRHTRKGHVFPIIVDINQFEDSERFKYRTFCIPDHSRWPTLCWTRVSNDFSFMSSFLKDIQTHNDYLSALSRNKFFFNDLRSMKGNS